MKFNHACENIAEDSKAISPFNLNKMRFSQTGLILGLKISFLKILLIDKKFKM